MKTPAGTDLRAAAEALGWQGEIVGPVEFGGVRFWSVVGGADDVAYELLDLVGCLVCGPARVATQEAASLLAAYAPRAVVVETGRVSNALLVDAALLDQGLVVTGPEGISCLSQAGPRVRPATGAERERRLHDRIEMARMERRLVPVQDGVRSTP